jgi:hypothetical protein
MRISLTNGGKDEQAKKYYKKALELKEIILMRLDDNKKFTAFAISA